MKKYDVPEGESAEFEPGSGERVLRNLLGITEPLEIEELETRAYEDAVNASILDMETDFGFTVDYIRSLHKSWLGKIYPFAGAFRTVNVSKEFVTFCPAANISKQLIEFEIEILRKHTPCAGMSREELARALAVVHVDFVLIHPFREGNGRLGRWIASLMALQAGEQMLDFSVESEESGRERYFSALRQGFAGNDAPCRELFSEILSRST